MLIEFGAVALSTAILIAASVLPFIGLRRSSTGTREHPKALNGLALSNCFACGIFLGTSFIALIPHVQMQEDVILNKLNITDHHSIEYPYLRSNVIILAGFLIILMIEQIAFLCTPASNSHNGLSTDAHYHSDSSLRHSRQSNGLTSGDQDINQPLVDLDSDSEQDELEEIQFRTNSHEHHHHHGADEEHGHHHHVLPGQAGSIEYILLLIALSVHSIFEGIALGAQKDLNGFMKFLLSTMLHEVLCSFAYGVSLSKHKIPLSKAIGSILFLSFSLPLGVLIMTGIGTFEALTALIFRFVLEGMAAGIFIYVATIEMLAAEIPHLPSKAGFIKATLVLIGATTFFFINLLLV